MEAIRVVVRVRPSPEQDHTDAASADTSLSSGLQPPDRTLVKVVDDQMLSLQSRGEKRDNYNFCYDHVFDGSATQEQVYEESAGAMVDHLLDGFNATIFAYGATGCGKTHTISGTPADPGLIFRVTEALYAKLEAQDTHSYDLKLSYLEIYNEKIRDLLSPATDLAIREDKSGVHVPNVSMHTPESVGEVEALIVQGNMQRAQSATHANAQSSRSHAVLQLRVVRRPLGSGLEGQLESSILSIVDLAGSERASSTRNTGKLLNEGAHINKSLLALGKCINALCTQSAHVPYRDSNLTRLLKFSLSGNCKTVMVACVSPNSRHYDDTLNTLNYANRAKQIKTRTSKNTRTVAVHVTDYKNKIEEQAQHIQQLQRQAQEAAQISTQRRADETRFEECMYRVLNGEHVSDSETVGIAPHLLRILRRTTDVLGAEKTLESPAKRARTFATPETPLRQQRQPFNEHRFNVPNSVKRGFQPDESFDTTF